MTDQGGRDVVLDPDGGIVGVFEGHTILGVKDTAFGLIALTDKGTYRLVSQTVAGLTVNTWERVYVA